MRDWTTLPLARRNPERVRRLARELSRFVGVGAICFALDAGLFNLLILAFDVGSVTAKVISTILATALSYTLNRAWSFAHTARTGVRRETSLFFLLNAIGLGISTGCLYLSHHVLGYTSVLADNISANFIGMGLATAFRFITYKRFVFVSHERAAARALDRAPVPNPEKTARVI